MVGPEVGIVEAPKTDDDHADRIETAVVQAGGTPIVGEVDDVLGSATDWIVADGEGALLSLVRSGTAGPVVPIEAGRGVRSVPIDAVEPAMESVIAGTPETIERRLLRADLNGNSALALFDVSFVTTEPARISTFTVKSGETFVEEFRGDGVVVATATGSRGYAARAGGPTIDPGTGVVGVVPVAPFATDTTDWILEAADVQVTADCAEAEVTMYADDLEVGIVPCDEFVSISTAGRMALFVVPESRSFYDDE
ncbi:MAG: NAD+ kinase [Halobacteriales archaeon]|jgi:NAD+ kinase